ncbi:MAG TPA: dUTP diphosphatase, partial [Hymenobacter sp.]
MMTPLQVQISSTSGLPLPAYQTEGAAGMDLLAATQEQIILQPGQRQAIPTGVHVALPVGYELQVRGRSGLAAKHGIGLVNGVGTIDSDYRGEIQVLLINHGHEPFVINHGDRIAQAVVAQYERIEWDLQDELEQTVRG